MLLLRRFKVLVLASSFVLLLLPCAPVCASEPVATKPTAAPNTATTVLRGRASWYGVYFQGRRTTSGERYNRFRYTCAHKTLPFGTRLRVTNVKNGKSVVVRVSDRGPFRHQRIIDLSEVAARPLGLIECGAATVVAEIVDATTPLGPVTTPENLAALYAADPDPEAAFTTYSVPASAGTPAEAASLIAAAPAGNVQAVLLAESVKCPARFLIQAGSFIDLANAQAVQARLQSLAPDLQVAVAQEMLDGRQRSRVLVGNFSDRPEAEAVRRRLMGWGIGGLVREVALR